MNDTEFGIMLDMVHAMHIKLQFYKKMKGEVTSENRTIILGSVKRDIGDDQFRYRERKVELKTQPRKPKHRSRMFDNEY